MFSEADILYSSMAGCIPNLNFSDMSKEERLKLANHCEVTRSGLCHCMSFIGSSLVAYANYDIHRAKQNNLLELGHGLNAIASLLPMLIDLEQLIRSDLREVEKQIS